MTNCIEQDSEADRPCKLTPTERRLLAQLDRSGSTSCTKDQMAVLLGRSRKTIDRLIADLKEKGFIDVTPCFAESGAQVANGYRVTEAGHERALLLNPKRTQKENGAGGGTLTANAVTLVLVRR